MTFKDFVAFALRMSGFWLVIDSILGVANASFLMSTMFDLPSDENQLIAVLIPVITSVVIGLLLAFMPYKITNFFIMDDVKVDAVPQFYHVLTRVGIALLGIYVVVTGIQYLVYDIVTYSYLTEQYSQFDDFAQKRNSTFISQSLRIVLGLILVLGSHAVSLWLTKTWVNAKK